MADTACTQELWQAIMRENPSGFKGDQRPVETVSWNGIQKFLQAVKQINSKLDIKLPTEAQWEYACRAGTTTAFNLGNEIDTQQVNFWGGSVKGRTVDVKSMQSPNQWGLHEMHGNVSEWCQDSWVRHLSDKPATDPVMEKTGDRRVIRGGAWYNGGGHVRSAYRDHDVPSTRYDFIGFRLLLGL